MFWLIKVIENLDKERELNNVTFLKIDFVCVLN